MENLGAQEKQPCDITTSSPVCNGLYNAFDSFPLSSAVGGPEIAKRLNPHIYFR